MAYFQDLLNFKYNLTGEQVNVGNLLREKKKRKVPVCKSPNETI